MSDVICERVNMIFETYGSGCARAETGQIKALGVTSSQRLAGLPNVATIADQGVSGDSCHLWLGLRAPAGLPDRVVSTLNRTLHAASNRKELGEGITDGGSEPMPVVPQQCSDSLKREASQGAKVVNDFALKSRSG